ncbi:MAG: SxtJ family membrane protein [Myxococcota bacterium]
MSRAAFAEIDRDPSLRTRLVFGVTLLVAFGLFAGLAWWSGRPGLAQGLAIAGAAAMLLAPLPVVGRAVYVAWMGLGIAIGLVTAPVILFVIYVLLIAPVGLAMRAAGRDVLRRRPDRSAPSYWQPYPRATDPRRYLKPY